MLRLSVPHSTAQNSLSAKYSHHFTPAKGATIIEADWLAASIIYIEDFTTTSTEEGPLDNGMMLYRSKNDKKSLMRLKPFATIRGI
jgi:hypothetical protein